MGYSETYTLKSVELMDKDHLINTVNKLSMNIERRRECLLELRKRFNKDYTYACGHCQIHTHAPSKRTYDGRMFEDDWYDSGKAEFYSVQTNWHYDLMPMFTNSHWKLNIGDTVTPKERSNEYDIYTEAQEVAMCCKHIVTSVSEYSFTLDTTGSTPWVYADISKVEHQKEKSMIGSLIFTGTRKQIRQFTTTLEYNGIPLTGNLTDIEDCVCVELVDGAELRMSETREWDNNYMIDLDHGFSIEALLQMGCPEASANRNISNMQQYDITAGINTSWWEEYKALKHSSKTTNEITSDIVYFKESHKQQVRNSFGVNFTVRAFKLSQSDVKGRHTLTSIEWPDISKDISTNLVAKYLTDKPDPDYHNVYTEPKITTTPKVFGKPYKPKGITMKSAITTQMDNNKAAAIMAAEITAGKVLNNKVVSIIKPKMPMMVRGYMDSPLASVAIANLVGIALKQYMPNNDKATKVSELMLNASALQLMESFNIEAMLDDLLAGIKLPETPEQTE